jgi:Cu/Ag efflux protein CusF
MTSGSKLSQAVASLSRGGAAALLATILPLAACSKSQDSAQAKRYHLHGKITSIDSAGGALVIEGDAIPGFMAAMTMPYTVHDKGDLARVGPGDEITADVVMPQESSSYIDNVTVVTRASAGGAAAAQQEKHYKLHGTVITINKDKGSLSIDADDIPGFMDAMTMPYDVKDKAEIDKVGAGDEITADLVVPADNGYYIQNIVVVKKAKK